MTEKDLPIIWLLGKTGAGKSTLVRALTGDGRVEIGGGFTPCTTASEIFDYPETAPVLRFLDTRGLGEIHYDPAEDLHFCQGVSHAVLAVVRSDDTETSALQDALRLIVRAKSARKVGAPPILLIHTRLLARQETPGRGVDQASRVQSFNQQTLESALERSIPSISVGLTPDEVELAPLIEAIAELLPELAEFMNRRLFRNLEQQAHAERRGIIDTFARRALALDVVPVAGLVAVPAIQSVLMSRLAKSYGVPWSRASAAAFAATLGTAFLYRYGLSLLARQAGKLLPGYGQTFGAVAAAGLSYASTLGLGRAVCLYCYGRVHQQAVDGDELRRAFLSVFQAAQTKETGEGER